MAEIKLRMAWKMIDRKCEYRLGIHGLSGLTRSIPSVILEMEERGRIDKKHREQSVRLNTHPPPSRLSFTDLRKLSWHRSTDKPSQEISDLFRLVSQQRFPECFESFPGIAATSDLRGFLDRSHRCYSVEKNQDEPSCGIISRGKIVSERE